MTVKGFVRASGTVPVPTLDAAQREVVDLPDAASAVVVGAPGTGKTTTIVELVAERVLARGWSPGELVVIGQSRSTATALRDRLALRLAVPTEGPLARSINSLAFEVVSFARRAAGLAPPRLLTGGDQDSDIAQLLAGHIEDGSGPDWPEPLGADVRALRGFRTELRETMMRATEYGLDPARLRQLATQHGRPEWAAVADFQVEYLQVMGELRPDQLDAAELTAIASRSIAAGVMPEAVSRLRLVIVDDLQEATRATTSMLSALAGHGVSVIAFGDPDVAANAFRGGEPDVVGRFGAALGIDGVRTMNLMTSHRQDATLLALTGAVTDRIGTAGIVGHRYPAPAPDSAVQDDGRVETISGSTPARLWSTIARRLRERHLEDETPFERMAIVLRSGAQVPAAARALALADVPTRTAVGGMPLREDVAARALLTVVDVGIGRTALTAESAVEALLGPFGGLDRLGLRRLRLALRTEELAGGGHRTSDELLVEALQAPGRFATIDHAAARSAGRLAETLAELAAGAAGGSSIEELLWLAWDRSGLAATWRQQALGAGILAAEANRNLDGVLALFTAAKRFVEREPESPATVFLTGVLDAEVPEDTLSPRAAADAVLVTTPSGVLGLEFDTVVVAGLQDGAWPNLRPRGSLLYPGELVLAANGIDGATIDSRREVLADELRMFALAVSRASREVILAAVANEDEATSVFLELAPDGAQATSAGSLPPHSLRGLVGRLRRELVVGGGAGAAGNLALLAASGVPGAAPEEWHGIQDASTTGPLYLDEETVPVSPSKLGAFEQSPVDWFIESISGTQSSTAMGLGTIVHWAMETATAADVDTVWAAIESRWNELLFEAPWLAEQQRRAARRLAAAVAEYLGDFERDGKTLVGAENRFTLDVGRARLNGSIDRVERSADGSVVIVDLKTGAAETSQAVIDEFPQLGAYQLAYASGVLDETLDPLGEHHAGGAKLLFVKEGVRGKSYREGVQAPLTEEQLEEFRERIRLAAIGMALGSYTGPRVLDPFGVGDTAKRALHRVRAVSSD
ncbi:superfamily I DNA/RNA helicase/RecB family exonuclease [Cryobacterium mesophilum]|uniref:ATP-dependent DNA helicase n=1 Tax=Terrimesophilobacter mesophilus TaxID=433647 RepID=UPI001425826E|nr:ATP-dependent DNA helicase [Terrimesophilobacter mesophilus]MBB5633863.1 superfamily I DNA/RNA helicase/RecB family exonuclease [Terrimesophilobacter mesophilus]